MCPDIDLSTSKTDKSGHECPFPLSNASIELLEVCRTGTTGNHIAVNSADLNQDSQALVHTMPGAT
jgi:hypothetical protein